MKKILCVALLSLAVPFAIACGDSTSDDGTDGGTTSGTSETCVSSHECINGACECTNEGRKGSSCTDDDKCEAECRVCTS